MLSGTFPLTHDGSSNIIIALKVVLEQIWVFQSTALLEEGLKKVGSDLSQKVIEGPFWPEPLRVVSSKQIGPNLLIEGVGLSTGKFYSRLLLEPDEAKIKVKNTDKDLSCDPEIFFLLLEGQRIRFAYQFDPFCAVNVSQIDPLPHQVDAVYYHILKNPRIRFLLADDPGAGKTIMAGLVLKELKQRGLAERVLIVVPGHLKDQWVRELKEKFGEVFFEVKRETMDARWGENIWRNQNQIITSMDFCRQDEVKATLAEADWDLIVVDEAHKMSAYLYGDKTKKTLRYKLGELLTGKTHHLLFLTATPHRGDPENFRLLLDLLEPGFFANTQMLNEAIEKKENPLFLRRLKEDLRNFDRTPLFPLRMVNTIKYNLSHDERLLYNAVTDYVQKYYQRALNKDKRNVTFALYILQKRMASSIRAIKNSLVRRKRRLEEIYRQGEIMQKEGYIDESTLEDLSEIERWKLEEELLEKLTTAETLEELKEEIDKLDDLVKLAKEAEKKEIETKLEELKKVMDSEHLKKNGTKLLIFTESRDTLEYLVEKIRNWGYSVTYIHGGMPLDKRIESEKEFKHKAQLMVATEAAGEGINLQFCWLMVNYDIPWNPNRLEQRMGRIHRYGQQNECHIYNLVAVETREGQILERLFKKLDTMREHLGDKVFDVVGNIMIEIGLEELIKDAIANRRTMDDILEGIDRTPDEELIEMVRRATYESLATRYMDLTKIIEETRVAKENRLVPEYIEKFFLHASKRLGLKVEKTHDGFWSISHVPFEIRNLSPSFKNKYGDISREYRKFSFDKEKAFKHPEVEFVAPGHPLLEGVIESLFIDYLEQMSKGTTFRDPSGRLKGVLHFLEAEIKDGHDKTVGKRLFVLFQGEDGSIKQVPSSILWDLKPERIPTSTESFPLLDDDQVTAFASEKMLFSYLEELKVQRLKDAEIKRKYGLKSLDELILQSETKLADYHTRRAKGEDVPDVTIQNEKRNRENLERRKRELEDNIEKETHLLPSPPRLIGSALIFPETQVHDSMKEDREVEELAMQMAMYFERTQGRDPIDVSSQNLGFDIRSSKEPETRYIEVKGRASEGAIALTYNEWLMAKRLKEEYWLYLVENAKMNPILYTIKNPAETLIPNEEVKIVRYIINNWKPFATKQPISFTQTT